jgi:hypothetical protein
MPMEVVGIAKLGVPSPPLFSQFEFQQLGNSRSSGGRTKSQDSDPQTPDLC